MQQHFPFSNLRLAFNPFRVMTAAEQAEIAVLSQNILESVQDYQFIQIMGHQGRGKTTTLLGLRYYLQQKDKEAEYHYIPRWHIKFQPTIRSDTVLILDETQRILPPVFATTIKNCVLKNTQLIFSSHISWHWLFVLLRIPLYSTTRRQHTQTHFAEIIERRLTYAALSTIDHSCVSFAPDAISYLKKCFGDDLRAMQYYLYDVFQDIASGISEPLEQLIVTSDLLETRQSAFFP